MLEVLADSLDSKAFQATLFFKKKKKKRNIEIQTKNMIKRELAFPLIQLPGIGTTFDCLQVICFWGEGIFQVLRKCVREKTNCLHNSEDKQAGSFSGLAIYLQSPLL